MSESLTLGWHWVATASGCNPDQTRGDEHLRVWLVELVTALGLTIVAGPHVTPQPGGGWVGFVLLAESHASIHVSEDGRTLFADVFSCRAFDHGVCDWLLTEAFAVESLDSHVSARTAPGGEASGP